MSGTSAAASKPTAFRRDIQGLRALAVAVVVLDHSLGWPSGGFVGVDVFFVISGYLITGALLREYRRTGRISFSRFYVSRARRILPAAIVTLAATVGLAGLLFSAQRAESVRWDGLWSLLSLENWNLAAKGTNYFFADGAVSPLQHFWSLSVEEQFYLAWPWLLLAVLALVAGSQSRARARREVVAVATVMAVVAVLSFAWAYMQSSSMPTVAYFSTMSRGWELALGGLVAVFGPVVGSAIPRVMRTVVAWAGLMAIVVACFILGPTTTWPAPWAALPTLGAALVIIASTGGAAPWLAPLTNRPAVFLGDISYSLYLWHFPVVVFAAALIPSGGRRVAVWVIVIAILLAVIQYFSIERPVWRSPVARSLSPGAWRVWAREHMVIAGAGTLLGTVLISGSIAAAGAVPQPQTQSFGAQQFTTATPRAHDLESAVRAGLALMRWTRTDPSVQDVGPQSKVDVWVKDRCLALEDSSDKDPKQTILRCRFGDPKSARHSLMIIGDSIAISYFPAVAGGLMAKGWVIYLDTMQQCPFAEVSVLKGDGSSHEECDRFHELVKTQASEIRPDFIVAAESDKTASQVRAPNGENALRKGLVSFFSQYASLAGRVIVLSAPPRTVAIEACYSTTASPQSCTRPVPDEHLSSEAILKSSMAAAGIAKVQFLELDPLFCAGRQCPAVVDGVIVRADGGHLTQDYSQKIEPAVFELMKLPR